MPDCDYDEIILIDQKRSDVHFEVENKIFCKLFIKRTFTSALGGYFNICTLYGSNLTFKTNNLITKNVKSLSLFIAAGDDRPVLMIIKPREGKQVVYYRSYLYVTTWEIYHNFIDESEDPESEFVQLLKRTFKTFYKVELMLSEYLFFNRTHNYDIYRYYVIQQKNYIPGYDRYILKLNKVHSISSITIERTEQKFSRDLSFTDSICFFFYSGDISTILLMEMWDYEMCDIPRRCFYFRRKTIGKDEWINVNHENGSETGMGFEKLKFILDKIVNDYDETPVVPNFQKSEIVHYHDSYTLSESGVRFRFDYNFYYYYMRNCLTQRVGKFFRVTGIRYAEKFQHIEIPKAQLTSICLFFMTRRKSYPVLISIGLYDRKTGKTGKYLWYMAQDFGSDIWVKLDFDATPDDNKKIEDKIRWEFEESHVDREIFLPWVILVFCTTFTIFSLLFLTGCLDHCYARFMRFMAERRHR